MVPGVMTYHLTGKLSLSGVCMTVFLDARTHTVVALHGILTFVNLIAFINVRRIVYKSLRWAQVLILGTVLLSLVVQSIALGLDGIVLSKINRDTAVASASAQGSFWL